jgi:ADP-ribose pyrophosphatase YjhB (NUDIX family)
MIFVSRDVLFKKDEFVFSYRVAGILIKNGKILLQKPKNDDGYSIPGGHVSFGETTAEALIREFKEEIKADIEVEKLIMVGENFFPWGNKLCQQISMYYTVSLCNEQQIVLDGNFEATDESGNKRMDLDFSWIPLSEIYNLTVYPTNITEDIITLPEHIKYFVYKDEQLSL